MAKKPQRLTLVDGSGYLFRAYHALPPMTRPDGTPVNAVYGFCGMLWKLLSDSETDGMAVVFDAGAKTFRNEIFPDYKANRPPAPEDLVPQFPLVRDAARAFGLPAVQMEGYEADDLIATYADQARAAGWEVDIVSSDKDLMQLVGDGVRMRSPIDLSEIGEAEVEKKFGVPPERVVDVQALAGDSTDNIAGVPGIGVKTAAELVLRFGDLEAVLAGAEEVTQPKRRERLIEHADDARMSLRLVTLKRDVPVEEPFESFARREPDAETLLGFLRDQDFKSLTGRIEAALGGAAAGGGGGAAPASGALPPASERGYELVVTEEGIAAWVALGRLEGTVAVDTETTSLDVEKANLVGVSLAVPSGRACYIPLGHVAPSGGDLFEPAPGQVPTERALGLLRELLEDPGVLKVGQNLKYDMSVLWRAGEIGVRPWDDTMLLSFVLDAGRHGHGLDLLAREHLDVRPIPYAEICGTGRKEIPFAEAPVEAARDYAAEDADLTLRLHALLRRRLLGEGMVSVYEEIERPLVPVIAAMERAGIAVDRDRLAGLSKDFDTRLARIAKDVHGLAGRPFNIASPKQLGEVLFDEQGLEQKGRTRKSKAAATDASVLEELAAEGHELPARVLDWRQLAKLKGTYTDALLQHSEGTGRVHTSFHMTGAVTGRLSSNDPNLQNIPVRTEDGRSIRQAFVAPEGHVLVCADYSQIELRLLAEVAEIGPLREAFAAGRDIHAATAERVFGVEAGKVDADLRRRAKAINFGIIYGQSAFGLARQIDVPQKEAQAYIDSYFATYPGIRDYMERAREHAREHGYVATLFGRRIHVPRIRDRNQAVRGHAERAAINAPLQGAAADIIKRAMARIPEALAAEGLKARMLLQVHDELVFEAPEGEAERTGEVAARVMREAPLPARRLEVPLVVDVGIGPNWDEAH